MKIEERYVSYGFTISLFVLSALYKSSAFAYAACLSFGLGLLKEVWNSHVEMRSGKNLDQVLRHKVEQIEAAVSAMVAREKARGW